LVKIRLQRMGTKARPFYRVVISKAMASRSSAAVEIIGTYNPVASDKKLDIKSDRAMHWLMEGAVPTETVAVLLKRDGVLEEFFTARPNHRAKYKFLDKRVAVTTAPTAIEAPVAEAPVALAQEIESAPEEVAAPVAEEATETPVETTTEA
jgi:small subunit ribosomal protein S16